MRRGILGFAVATTLAASSPALAAVVDPGDESPAAGAEYTEPSLDGAARTLHGSSRARISTAGLRSLAAAYAQYAAASGDDLAGTHGAYSVSADAEATFVPIGALRGTTSKGKRAGSGARRGRSPAARRPGRAPSALAELANTHGVYEVNAGGHPRFTSYGRVEPARPRTPTAPPETTPTAPSPSPARPGPTPQPQPARTPVPTPPAPGSTYGGAPATAKTLFASTFADGLSEYRHQIHPERIRVVDDPVLGSARKVLRFQVHQADTGPTENPRAQIETPYDFKEGDDRYFGFSLYFPADFPAELPSQGWVTIGEQAYGPPYDGAAGTSLRVQNAPGDDFAELRWQRNDSYGWDMPWRGPRIDRVRGRWIDIVQRIKLHRDARIGFVEMWMNSGDGYRRQKLAGQDRLHMRTYDSANDDGPNNSRLSLYYRNDIPGPLTLFHGPHRIAAAGPGAFSAVAPTSYGVAGAEP